MHEQPPPLPVATTSAADAHEVFSTPPPSRGAKSVRIQQPPRNLCSPQNRHIRQTRLRELFLPDSFLKLRLARLHTCHMAGQQFSQFRKNLRVVFSKIVFLAGVVREIEEQRRLVLLRLV